LQDPSVYLYTNGHSVGKMVLYRLTICSCSGVVSMFVEPWGCVGHVVFLAT